MVMKAFTTGAAVLAFASLTSGNSADAAQPLGSGARSVEAIGSLRDGLIPELPTRNPTPSRKTVAGPVKIVISIPNQRLDVYRGTQVVASSPISSGRRGYETPQGVFSILQKNQRHFSNIYRGAPMPFMQRITWSGIAMHAGSLPGYPASHGCIRLPYSFARKLFKLTEMGGHVVVNRGRPSPQVIEHASLFQAIEPKAVEHDFSMRLALADTSDPVQSKLDVEAAQYDLIGRYVSALKDAHHPNATAKPRTRVRLVQRLLQFNGYNPGSIDSDFGPSTRKALARFMRAEGISGRPVVNTEMTNHLYWALGSKMMTMPEEQVAKLLTPVAGDQPLRILITRRAKSGVNVRDAQDMLNTVGFDAGEPDGALGPTTRAAIRAFQKAQDLPVTGTVNIALMNALFEATGREQVEQTNGHLYVRQGYRDIYDAPIEITQAERPLGTHLYSVAQFSGTDAPAVWTALTVKQSKPRVASVVAKELALDQVPSTAEGALDRIVIPAEVREEIGRRLTAGSSLIISDNGKSNETGEHTDFIVETR